MITIAHIVNPVKVEKTSDLLVAQPVTFETMKAAREAAGENIEVEFFAALYPEDLSMVPDGFNTLAPLTRSVLDTGTFKKQKKLPLLKDILDPLYEKTTAGYVVYTNVDIALMPGFYREVGKIIEKGYDGFVINRRTISSKYSEIKDIPAMIAEAESGKKHPGFDCFVFKRGAYPNFRLGDACVGANWIGRVMIANIMAFSHKFKVFEELHLTFHIGDERIWQKNDYDDYSLHNETQLVNLLETLTGLENVNHKPGLTEFYHFHLKNLQTHSRVPGDIIARNSPLHFLPDKPENIYHNTFRTSDSWEDQHKPIIRQDPIFIAGYPRSGTTLVQSLIATQENIYSFHETHFFTRVRSVLNVRDDHVLGALRDDEDRHKLEPCFNTMVNKIRERISFSKNAEAHIKNLVTADRLSPKMLFEIIVIDNLINQVELKTLNRVRWMEKTPSNELFLDAIFRFYPSAKIVYVIRHPEKAIISRRKHFNLVQQEKRWPVRRHINEWLHSVNEIERYRQAKPGSVSIVRLEDITTRMPEEMKKICRFLDIEFNEEKLENYKNISKTLYFPWEYWKGNTSRDISGDIALRKNENLSFEEKNVLRSAAQKKMENYGYSTGGPENRENRDNRGPSGEPPLKRIYKIGNALQYAGKEKVKKLLRRLRKQV